jgi:hypothetical protein
MLPMLISPSGEKYHTLEDKMEAISRVSFPTKTNNTEAASQNIEILEGAITNQELKNPTKFTVCLKMLKRFLKKTNNSSAPGLEGIGWQELKIWFLLDPSGL